jgi:hypothetical protein
MSQVPQTSLILFLSRATLEGRPALTDRPQIF